MKIYVLYVLTEQVLPYAISTNYNNLNLLKKQLIINLEVTDANIWIEEKIITNDVTEL